MIVPTIGREPSAAELCQVISELCQVFWDSLISGVLEASELCQVICWICAFFGVLGFWEFEGFCVEAWILTNIWKFPIQDVLIPWLNLSSASFFGSQGYLYICIVWCTTLYWYNSLCYWSVSKGFSSFGLIGHCFMRVAMDVRIHCVTLMYIHRCYVTKSSQLLFIFIKMGVFPIWRILITTVKHRVSRFFLNFCYNTPSILTPSW